MLRVGYKASAEQFAPADLLRFAVQAERGGLDSVFISDHFQPFRHTGGHAPFSMAWLGALGACTERVVMGTSALTPTLRYHPSVVAHAFATLGAMFPGRVVLGVGTGESLNEVAPTGIEWPAPGERTARLREAVDLIHRLWSGERVSFEGQHYRTVDAMLYDLPPRPVPIYIAAAGPVVARMAGARGEGFICTSGKPPELYRQTLLPALTQGLESAGRTLQSIDRMIEVKLSFHHDRQQALHHTRFWGALALGKEEKLDVQDAREMERRADALPIERAASRFIVTNDADEVIERVRPYVELGFGHLVFHSPQPDQARFVEDFCAQVLPRLRRAF